MNGTMFVLSGFELMLKTMKNKQGVARDIRMPTAEKQREKPSL